MLPVNEPDRDAHRGTPNGIADDVDADTSAFKRGREEADLSCDRGIEGLVTMRCLAPASGERLVPLFSDEDDEVAAGDEFTAQENEPCENAAGWEQWPFSMTPPTVGVR